MYGGPLFEFGDWRERVSKYQFGCLMAEAAGFSMKNVRRGSIRYSRLLAPRPEDISLDSERFRRATGVEVPECMPGIRCFLGDRVQLLSARFDMVEEDLLRTASSAKASRVSP